METFWIKAAQLIVALLILVTIHEFGHYFFARIFGIKVNRFYLFFNPWFSILKWYPNTGKLQLIAWTKKVKDGEETKEEPKALVTLNVGKKRTGLKATSWRNTLYGIGWLPLGGYCDIAGMIDETKSANDLAEQAQPWEFRSKAAWKRLMVMVAGVLFNFLLAIIIYSGIVFYWGEHVIQYKNAYEGLDFSPRMESVGFKTGDIPIAINGKPIDAKDDAHVMDMLSSGANVTVLRNGTETQITIPDSLLLALNKAKEQPFAIRMPAFVGATMAGLPAEKIGIQAGDRIVKVNNDTTPALTEFVAALDKVKKEDKPATYTVLRGDSLLTFETALEDGKLGVQWAPIDSVYVVDTKEYSLWQAPIRGAQSSWEKMANYVSSLKLLFSKEGASQIGGFGTIGELFPKTWDWYSFWNITAFLSIILAFMNIIPIPGLDGGHVLFTLWEMILRRKPSDKFLEIANTIGMGFLFLLLIYANGNDIIRLFFK